MYMYAPWGKVFVLLNLQKLPAAYLQHHEQEPVIHYHSLKVPCHQKVEEGLLWLDVQTVRILGL